MKATVTCLALWFTALIACASGEKVCLIKINGAIGPATASYISRSIDEAQSQNAQCLIIQLNTPGGLLESTQVIVQKLLASPVPVVVYVAPTGATATSAGCFITLAASVAAMAPATTIGAAHPVTIGGGIPSGDGQKTDDTMKQKLENFSVSYIEAPQQTAFPFPCRRLRRARSPNPRRNGLQNTLPRRAQQQTSAKMWKRHPHAGNPSFYQCQSLFPPRHYSSSGASGLRRAQLTSAT
jgi:ATP-dependent protease ClpP protease subunit